MGNKMFTRYDDTETLERIKRWPSLLKRFPRVRIYSAEHHAYWRGTGQGYTDQTESSTVMDIEEAFAKTRHCGPEKRIRFIKATEPPSPWIPASTPPKKDGLYSCLVKHSTVPRSYNFKHGKWQTPGTEVTYYMEIPPLPEKNQ